MVCGRHCSTFMIRATACTYLPSSKIGLAQDEFVSLVLKFLHPILHCFPRQKKVLLFTLGCLALIPIRHWARYFLFLTWENKFDESAALQPRRAKDIFLLLQT